MSRFFPHVFPDLRHREMEPEVMDDPDIAVDEHEHALAGLSRLNRLSFSDAIVWQPIRELARTLDRPLRVLDIASGAGDVLVQIWRRAAAENVSLELTGIDISETALSFAKQRAETIEAPITFQHHDALEQPLPAGHDVIMCSLFLHHLTQSQAGAFLSNMQGAAEMAVLVNDLRRVRLGYWLAWLATRTMTRSRVVHIDSLLSIRAAFTIEEVRRLAAESGLGSARFTKCWPYRFLLDWRRQ